MNQSEQRCMLRGALNGPECIAPASVYDPLSARIAERVGHRFAVLPGSEVSHTTLAAPDHTLITITEFADQIRRIARVSRLSLFVDADHGYGNALNVMRTVAEFEHAGVAGLCIEDTVLPRTFGDTADEAPLISVAEALGKFRAAVAARRDPALVIAARTTALRTSGLDEAVNRLRAYAESGVDAVFVVGVKTLAELDALRTAVKLPIMLGSAPNSLRRSDLAEHGARFVLQGHHDPVAGVVRTLSDIYQQLLDGGDPKVLEARMATKAEMAEVTQAKQYAQWQLQYLR